MIHKQCPICKSEDCNELIIDLLICNNCSHIYKKENYKHSSKTIKIGELHKLYDPVNQLWEYIETHKQPNKSLKLKFEFPSIMFQTLDLFPNDFYHFKNNQYFNQISLMILFKRCNIKIIEQKNIQSENGCLTIIDAQYNDEDVFGCNY